MSLNFKGTKVPLGTLLHFTHIRVVSEEVGVGYLLCGKGGLPP